MMRKVHKRVIKTISALTAALLIASSIRLPAKAYTVMEDPMVVVSLGDSYSAGEGIEPFYGQNKSLTAKMQDRDWLAHRSTRAWPALLEFPGISGTTGNYRVAAGQTGGAVCQWYFAAASGAVSSHIDNKTQHKKAVQKKDLLFDYIYEDDLPKQIEIFKSITEDVDYVTMTMGGNDVKFASIIQDCVLGSTYLHFSSLQTDINDLWDRMPDIEKKITKAYKAIAREAGPQATIIVAGYPKPMHPNAAGAQAYARCVNAKISALETGRGSIVGQVVEAQNRSQSISDAIVTLTRNGENSTTTSTDIYGQYREKLPAGAYVVDVSAPGHVSAKQYAEVAAGQNIYLETVLMVYGDTSDTGVARGKIINAYTGNGVGNADITVRLGMNNTQYGDAVATTQSAEDGSYELNLNLGNYTIEASKNGFVTSSFNIVVQKGTTDNQNGSITPILSADEYRIVLTWGDIPADLDSHVEGYGSDSSLSRYHVYYSEMWGYTEGMSGECVCELDIDAREGRGPETITLKTTSSQPYYYYVHNYSNEAGMAISGAKVKLYQGNNEVGTWNIPVDQGNGLYWNVFAIMDGVLIPNDSISDEPDLEYATYVY